MAATSQFADSAAATAAWAHALTDLMLAEHLMRAANQSRYLTSGQRRALMREAAARLEEAHG